MQQRLPDELEACIASIADRLRDRVRRGMSEHLLSSGDVDPELAEYWEWLSPNVALPLLSEVLHREQAAIAVGDWPLPLCSTGRA